MKTKNHDTLLNILTAVLFAIPFVNGILRYHALPDTMVTHVNAQNLADGYASKNFALFGIPLFMIAIYLFARFATRLDPKRKNQSPRLRRLLFLFLPVLGLALHFIMIARNLKESVDVGYYLMIGFSLMMILLGNFFPKTKQNYTMGIRLPWTLASEDNWNKTHRLAGYLWVAGGIVLLLLTLLGKQGSMLSVGVITVVVLLPIAYSALLYYKGNRGMPPEE